MRRATLAAFLLALGFSGSVHADITFTTVSPWAFASSPGGSYQSRTNPAGPVSSASGAAFGSASTSILDAGGNLVALSGDPAHLTFTSSYANFVGAASFVAPALTPAYTDGEASATAYITSQSATAQTVYVMGYLTQGGNTAATWLNVSAASTTLFDMRTGGVVNTSFTLPAGATTYNMILHIGGGAEANQTSAKDGSGTYDVVFTTDTPGGRATLPVLPSSTNSPAAPYAAPSVYRLASTGTPQWYGHGASNPATTSLPGTWSVTGDGSTNGSSVVFSAVTLPANVSAVGSIDVHGIDLRPAGGGTWAGGATIRFADYANQLAGAAPGDPAASASAFFDGTSVTDFTLNGVVASGSDLPLLLDTAGSGNALTITAAPEPACLGFRTSVAACLGASRRRHRRVSA